MFWTTTYSNRSAARDSNFLISKLVRELKNTSSFNYPGLITRTLGPSNDFTLLNGWICLHGVLD